MRNAGETRNRNRNRNPDEETNKEMLGNEAVRTRRTRRPESSFK